MSLCSIYVPTPTMMRFHEDDSFVKMVVGPFASGKSVGTWADVVYYSMAQAAAPDGVRYSKWGVIRATYQQIKDGPMRTILNFMPEGSRRRVSQGMPCRAEFYFPLNDGTHVHLEVTMLALESADVYMKLRGYDWTGCWINEADGIPYEIFSEVQGRIGRYPGVNLGSCSWAGILMDFNQPPQGHYLLNMIENPQSNWAVFRQPPAAFKVEHPDGTVTYDLNTEAENLCNIGVRKPEDRSIEPGLTYYRNQIESDITQRRFDRIDHQFCMLDIMIHDGKPVFPDFSRDSHVAKGALAVQAFRPVICGMDTSGIHPAIVILQENMGKWCILDEIYGENMGLEAFVEQAMIPLFREKYTGCDVLISCDPANARDSYRAITPSSLLKEYGFNIFLATTNKPKARIRAVEVLLNKQVGGLLIDPQCRLTIDGLAGGYHYKKRRVSGSIVQSYDAIPEKDDIFSHIADAIQYAALYITKGTGPTIDNDSNFAVVAGQIRHRQDTLRQIAR